MELTQAFAEWVSNHPWLTFFVLITVADVPARVLKTGAEFTVHMVKK